MTTLHHKAIRLVSSVKQRLPLSSSSCTIRIPHVREQSDTVLIYHLRSEDDANTFIHRSPLANRSMSLPNRGYHTSANITPPSTTTTPTPTKRHSSTKAKGNNAARDTRVGGRRRFYKVVDITPLAAPWEHLEEEVEEEEIMNMVDNPISAGVDGTNSATNVNFLKPTKIILRQALNPKPKTKAESYTWYGITLDGATMRTPLGTPLSVPSPTLALAIASEWDSQINTISPAQMPLMTLTCTTLDQLTLPSARVLLEEELMAYLKNDTTCFQSDATEDRLLARRQSNAWEGILEWVESEEGLGYKPAVAVGAGEGLIMSRKRKNKVMAGLPHPEALLKEARVFLESCTAWELAVMQMVTVEAKSFLVGMTVVKGITERDEQNPFRPETNKAVVASRVEEEFQIDNWGLVEGGHDYDRLNCSINIHAASFLLQSIVSSSSE